MRWVWSRGASLWCGAVLSCWVVDATNAQAVEPAALDAGSRALEATPRWQPSSGIRDGIAAASKHGAISGVCVIDDRGRVVYENHADRFFAPASSLKVLTAAAVLRGLGPTYRFATRFDLQGGALVVRASGDPNWITDSVHRPAARFGEVVAELQRRGITRLSAVHLDPGTFTGPARPSTWPQNQLYTYYCAPTGPFVLDQAVFWLAIDPRGRQSKPAVRCDGPLVGPPLQNKVQLVHKRGVSSCGAIDYGDRLLVRGKLTRGNVVTRIRTAVKDPATWYHRALLDLLARAGITVGGAGPFPADGHVHTVTTTLPPAILRILEESSNFDAEQCLRVLGAEFRRDGSLAGGLSAMREQLTAMQGRLPSGFVLADGSGLSKDNRVSARLLARVLHDAQRRPFGVALRQALPIAGRTGTLSKRFRGSGLEGRVRAKTGWIRGSSSLSGYVDVDGRTLSFAVLMGYDRKKSGVNKHLKAAQERIVAGIAGR